MRRLRIMEYCSRLMLKILASTLFHRLLKNRASGSVETENLIFIPASGNMK